MSPIVDMGSELSLASAAGVLSFVSPCVWPALLFCTAVAALGPPEPAADRPFLSRLFPGRVMLFALGYWLGFLVLGLPAEGLGRAAFYAQNHLRLLLGGMVAVTGGRLAWAAYRGEPEPLIGPLGFLFGLALAVVWAPCPGRVLVWILMTAAHPHTSMPGLELLVVYGSGFTVMLGLWGLTAAQVFEWRRHAPQAARRWMAAWGLGLVPLGIAAAFGWLNAWTPRVTSWLMP